MKPSLTLLTALLFTPLAATADPASKPNVIIILTDDQGYGDIGAHGHPFLKTPNLDKLRAESVRFTDFHVAPMCSPTRGQLMTGVDAMKNGCTAVNAGRSMVREDIPMLSNYFPDAGYATGLFGKWHMGDSHPYRPQDRGFQEVLSFRAWGLPSLASNWGNSTLNPNKAAADAYRSRTLHRAKPAAVFLDQNHHEPIQSPFPYIPFPCGDVSARHRLRPARAATQAPRHRCRRLRGRDLR